MMCTRATIKSSLGSIALGLAALSSMAKAATVTYDFNVSWVTSNPDGLQERPTIGINGQWPIPRIDVNVGDRVVINLLNSLGNQSTSLHFHGLYLEGQAYMDGPSMVSQCPVPPGARITYNFTINQPGTYWYHSHTLGQYPDGLRGPLVVHDPKSPFLSRYDEEIVLTVSDWYHDEIPVLQESFISKYNPTGAEPVPKSALMNDTQNLTIPVQPGKTYFFRMVNIGAFAGQYIWFEGHNMTILEQDGIYTQPTEASMIYLGAAQRCSFLITTRNDTSANFPIVSSMDTTLFDTLPDDLNWNVTGWLVYDSAKPNPDPALVDTLDPIDDTTVYPYDNQTILGEPDQVISLDVIMDNLGDGASYAFFDNITYTAPKVPTLYTALSAGALADDPAVYGEYTHAFVLKKNQIVEVVVNNLDTGRHPFHLHGHAFQVLYRSADDAGAYADSNITAADFPSTPMRRDTLVLYPSGFFVFRFQASNPGVWLFHCHIEWHLMSGLVATMVEAPMEMQKNFTIPQDHFDTCALDNIPTTGNAAGNTVNFLDLTGQNAAPAPLPEGFTPRGIAAIVMSIICGILGVSVVAWYGLADVGKEQASHAEPIRTTVPNQVLSAPMSNSAGQDEIMVVAGSGGGGRRA